MTFRTLATLALLALVPMVHGGCYSRLTTPKEAREFRATYPELDQGLPVDLQNARDNLGSTFIMTAETYLDGVRRYNRSSYGLATSNVHRFKAGSEFEIELVDHPENKTYNRIFKVTPEGLVDIGQIRDFPVAGRTRRAIRADLEQRLSRFFKGFPNPDDPPNVAVNIPTSGDRLVARGELGQVTVFSAAVQTGTQTRSGGGNSGGNSSSGGNEVLLRGDDTLLHVLGRSGEYNESVDWHEIVIARKVTTSRVHTDSGQPFQYWVLIVCDLEKTIFEDFNQNLDIQDNDLIILHAEKSPLIVELFRSALVVAEVYDAFQGFEFVVEDLFKRDY